MKLPAAAALAVASVAFCLPSAPAAADDGICAPRSAESYDELSGIWSPCAVARGALVAEATYLQNASAVGGTALAAYPMIELRTGIAPRIEFAFHAPSQVAESGERGTGLYPSTHLGYGLRYGFLQAPRLAAAFVTDILPPMSRFSPNQIQPRYVFGITSAYALEPRLDVGIAMSGTSSGTVGFQRILPSEAVRASYALGSHTNLATDIGSRFPARHAQQTFGDVALDQTLLRNLAFTVGLGTAFNAAMNSKAHYLASGFNYAI